jgi:alpha-galactosidase
MIVWDRDETPEGAAQAILSSLYSVIQYSMVLADIREDHKAVIRHWISFARQHCDTLLKGKFRPHHPELGYPVVEAESETERIVTVYGISPLLTADGAKKTFIINATDSGEIPVRASHALTAEIFNVFGHSVSTLKLNTGITAVTIPPSGYAVFSRSR